METRPSTPNGTTDPPRFEIHECVGRGGFGEVYRATMLSDSGPVPVAVKVLMRDTSTASQEVLRLRDEGRILNAIQHPSILGVHDLLYLDGRIALVMEFVDGQDLADCLKDSGRLEPHAALAIIGAVADALHAAWSAPGPDGGALHLIHRDIKPANIRLGRDGAVKLLDFGIARAEAVDREARTGTDNLVGSYLYMAPERFLENSLEPPSDVFSLGCTLYELLAGERLFANHTLRDTYKLVLEQGRFDERIESRLELLHLSTDVVELVRDTVAYRADDRPGADALAARCREVCERLQGPSLASWCAGRSWPDIPDLDGPLSGRTMTATIAATDKALDITEDLRGYGPTGAMAASISGTVDRHPLPIEPEPSGSRLTWVMGGGLLTLAVAAVVAFLVFSVSGTAALLYSRSQPGPVGPIAPPESPVIEAVGDGPTIPAPRVEGDENPPDMASPEPVVTPTPVPVAEPVPQPEAPPAMGRVLKEGRGDFQLRKGGERRKPGPVPVGTWTIEADFGSGLADHGTVTVVEDAVVRVRCKILLQTCEVL